MTYILRLLILFTFSLLGGLFFSLSVNFLIMGGLISAESVNENFGQTLIEKAVYVWIGAVALGLIGVFMEYKALRLTLIACPLLLPAIFALVYTLSSQ
jgi:cell division protein FtsW (lipid II flippase)